MNVLNAKTSVSVGVTSTRIIGTFADLNDAFDADIAGTISGLGNEEIILNAAITVSQFNTLAAKTSGIITATISDNDMATLAGIAESGHALTISVTDAVVVAADLNVLDNKTTGAVTITSTTIAGSSSDINTVYASNGISGLGDEVLIITDTNISASSLLTLDNNTTGALTPMSAPGSNTTVTFIGQ